MQRFSRFVNLRQAQVDTEFTEVSNGRSVLLFLRNSFFESGSCHGNHPIGARPALLELCAVGIPVAVPPAFVPASLEKCKPR